MEENEREREKERYKSFAMPEKRRGGGKELGEGDCRDRG